MIEGELYVLANCPKCVFAYKSEDERVILHYACVNCNDRVRIPGINYAAGRLTNIPTRIANDEERSRFYEHLHESGYYYNIENRKVIQYITGELI